MSTVLDAARAFLAEDFDTATLAELQALIDRAVAGDPAATAQLEDRFAGNLTFGTAGLRGRVEAGTNRMNRVVVAKATWGLGEFLLKQGAQHGVDVKKQGVVVAFDGRLSSRTFSEDAAAILGAMGIPVLIFPDPQPTPVCAFAVADLKAAAGIMVTASHNPPADNGYKVYWANAAQIIPPIDDGVMAAIATAPKANTIARIHPPDAAIAGLRRLISDDLEHRYLAAIRALAWHKPKATGLPVVHTATPLRIVYTAMHGVGHHLTVRGLQQAGFEGVVIEPTQTDPDGTFRTVAFPNPEEKGALDLALKKACVALPRCAAKRRRRWQKTTRDHDDRVVDDVVADRCRSRRRVRRGPYRFQVDRQQSDGARGRLLFLRRLRRSDRLFDRADRPRQGWRRRRCPHG